MANTLVPTRSCNAATVFKTITTFMPDNTTFLSLPMTIIAALPDHVAAGGLLLALSHDYVIDPWCALHERGTFGAAHVMLFKSGRFFSNRSLCLQPKDKALKFSKKKVDDRRMFPPIDPTTLNSKVVDIFLF
ncbi:hypothetical protein ACLB2K_041989 [Fragaria x ananassa]